MKKNASIKVGQKGLTISSIALVMFLFAACKKDEHKNEVYQPENKSLDQRLTRFLSVSINIDSSRISYNATTKEFVVGDIYRISRKDLEERYAVANEYKLNFEK